MIVLLLHFIIKVSSQDHCVHSSMTLHLGVAISDVVAVIGYTFTFSSLGAFKRGF